MNFHLSLQVDLDRPENQEVQATLVSFISSSTTMKEHHIAYNKKMFLLF